MVAPRAQDYRSGDSREFQIGVARKSGGGRIGAARLVLVTALAVLAFGAGPLAAGVDAAASKTTAPTAPKVVIVVGPAGSATPFYRRLADEAAADAAKLTTNVVKVYS